ncbi:unnamed protein product [Adineta ricciae]|uniref:Uncharacterized protein n=1 Tax=Adineta ricciae TaxID=249248 RepID=A0A816DJ61_ADIRI|nr:unnamed protein product [Adineta ricciae]
MIASVKLNNKDLSPDALKTSFALSAVPTTIDILFIKEVILQNISIANPTESKITSISALTDFDDVPRLSDNPSSPSIRYSPYMEDVIPLTVVIKKTSDGTVPSNTRLSIIGCAKPTTIATKAQIEQDTTTTSNTKSTTNVSTTSSQPGQTTQPGQPGLTTQPGQPGLTTQPGQPGQTTQPGQPGQTTQPGQPGLTTRPGQQPQTTQPGQPGQTTQPGQPGQTTQPGQPGQTTQPGQPGQTTQPGQPGQTTQPGQPGLTTQPGQPGLTTQPGQPGLTTQPGQSGLTTQPGQTVTGTTTKQCVEMEAVDEATSKKIIVTPNELPEEKKADLQPTSKNGVSFPANDRTPTFIVNFDKPAEVQSVIIPRDRTQGANVEQFQVTLYFPNGSKVNPTPIQSTDSPKDDKSKPATVDSSKLPSNAPVSKMDVTVVKTTDGESPKGVVLSVKACTQPSTSKSHFLQYGKCK